MKRTWIVSLGIVASIATAAHAEERGIPEGSPVDFLTVAQIAAEQKQWRQAEKILRDGMTRHPKSDGFHLSLGYVFEQEGRLADAFYEYQWELQRAGIPELAEAAARRSAAILERKEAAADDPRAVMEALALGEKDPAAARKRLVEISARTGSPFALRVYAAEMAALAKDRKSAEKELRELTREDPAFVPGYVALARIFDQTGRKKDAEAALARAREVNAQHWALTGR